MLEIKPPSASWTFKLSFLSSLGLGPFKDGSTFLLSFGLGSFSSISSKSSSDLSLDSSEFSSFNLISKLGFPGLVSKTFSNLKTLSSLVLSDLILANIGLKFP